MPNSLAPICDERSRHTFIYQYVLPVAAIFLTILQHLQRPTDVAWISSILPSISDLWNRVRLPLDKPNGAARTANLDEFPSSPPSLPILHSYRRPTSVYIQTFPPWLITNRIMNYVHSLISPLQRFASHSYKNGRSWTAYDAPFKEALGLELVRTRSVGIAQDVFVCFFFLSVFPTLYNSSSSPLSVPKPRRRSL